MKGPPALPGAKGTTPGSDVLVEPLCPGGASLHGTTDDPGGVLASFPDTEGVSQAVPSSRVFKSSCEGVRDVRDVSDVREFCA